MMKQAPPRIKSTVLAVLLAVILLSGNTLAMSACGSLISAADTVTMQNPLLATAVAEYFGLSDPGDLTAEHLALIRSIEILMTDTPRWEEYDTFTLSDGTQYTPVRIRINDGAVYAGGIFYENRSNSPTAAFGGAYDFQTLPEMLTEGQIEALRTALSAANPSAEQQTLSRFNTFYTKIGPNENRSDTEVLAEFPYYKERSVYVIDSSMNRREIYALTEMILLAGLGDSRAVRAGSVDLSDLAAMPNLTEVAVSERFTAVNTPSGLTVTAVPLAASAD